MRLVIVLLALFLSAAAEAQTLQTPDPDRIEDVEVRNNRRVQSQTILYQIQTKPGDRLNPAIIRRDIRTLYGMGAFSDVTVIEEQGETGKIIIFRVQEKPTVRRIASSNGIGGA